MLNPLQKLRQQYLCTLPQILNRLERVGFVQAKEQIEQKDSPSIQELFPHTFHSAVVEAVETKESKVFSPLRVGVLFSGGQAAGGHNVISGLFDALKKMSSQSVLFGFLKGPGGIIEGKYVELDEQKIAPYRNQGGFDLIGSGRTKIETEEQLKASLATATALQLDGVVIVGGDDSNTNAAILAEYFLKERCPTKVIGVPKTIDGDLRNAFVPISFGFDTATKIYSEMISNLARDALSAKKYYHFIKLMGRSASHITLECALATRPNYTLIGEEIAAQKVTLAQIVERIADLICRRSMQKKSYGIILIPEGIIEFIPEMATLIGELNQNASPDALSFASLRCFEILPKEIQKQLLFDRDPHGNVQLSLVETEKLLIELVAKELSRRSDYKDKFYPLSHFFGYEGRAGYPSNFDCHYCYALGVTAALLLQEGLTGYLAAIRQLSYPAADWSIGGVPLVKLLTLESRKGKMKPVIQKALVDLKGKAFHFFSQERHKWEIEDNYRFVGPMQFFGPQEITDAIALSLKF